MYKTILVHLSSAASMGSTMRLAASVARRQGAHLIGTASSGMAEVNYLLALGAPMAMMPGSEIDLLRSDAETKLGQFEAHCREFGVDSYETRLFDLTTEDALLMQSRYCDLVIAGQGEIHSSSVLMPLQLTGALVSKAARPVLLVPQDCNADAAFERILVAWNGSLEASRAVAFGMPLIRAAAKVVVAVINPDQERIDTGGEPGADLATYLARQHPAVELVRRDTHEPIHTALAAVARETGADLMLGGAYGHSRWHDWVLGSTTRALLEQAQLPILMSH